MQPSEEIELHYSTPDPWGYQTNPDDLYRKDQIILACKKASDHVFESALDIGAGEGWITQDLPAKRKHGFELSSQAMSRFPSNVIPVSRDQVILSDTQYDLVTACGVLYGHYNYPLFLDLIRFSSVGIVVTCNIKDWEVKEMSDPIYLRHELGLCLVQETEFKYREFRQSLKTFRVIGR